MKLSVTSGGGVSLSDRIILFRWGFFLCLIVLVLVLCAIIILLLCVVAWQGKCWSTGIVASCLSCLDVSWRRCDCGTQGKKLASNTIAQNARAHKHHNKKKSPHSNTTTTTMTDHTHHTHHIHRARTHAGTGLPSLTVHSASSSLMTWSWGRTGRY